MARDPIAVLDETAPPPTDTVAYGSDPSQVYDVRLPAGRARPGSVVVVHGGFWRAAYDRAHAGPQAQALAEAGWPVAVVEYRRAGMPGGGWPGTADDVAAAVRAVRADPRLPRPHVLLGHSAGGQLVTWAAAQPWAAGLAGVVSLAGLVDLPLASRLGLGAGAVDAFLGGTPAQVPGTFAAADPAGLAPGIPVVLLHGEDDQVVPAHLSSSYAVRHASAQVTLERVPGCEHYGLIDPEHPAFDRVVAAVERLRSASPAAGRSSRAGR